MKELRDANLHEVLYKAANIISEVGFTRHMHCDPDSGAVDIEGAIMLALGANRLPVLVIDVTEFLPETSQAAFDACLAILESEVGDLTNWVDGRGSQAEAVRLLGRLGDELAIL